MTLTASYDGVLSRVRLSGSSLGASATYAVFDRTINGYVTTTTIRGGSEVTVTSQNAAVDDYEFPVGQTITYRVRSYNASDVLQQTFTTTILRDLDEVWLKVPAGPYLNLPVTVVDRSEIERKSRSGLFPVVGRTMPVMVGDIASSRSFTLQVLTQNASGESALDYLFASGEVVFLHLPSTVEHFPGGYFAVGDVKRETTLRLSARRIWSVPLTEVAIPGPAVVGSAYTWNSAMSEFATWTDLIAANVTWSTLLQRVGAPSDVIVG